MTYTWLFLSIGGWWGWQQRAVLVLADRGSLFMKMFTSRCNCWLSGKSCVKLFQIVWKKVLISDRTWGTERAVDQTSFFLLNREVLGTLKILQISRINNKGDFNFHWNHYPTTPWWGQSLGAQSQDEWLPLTHFRLQEFFHGMGWFFRCCHESRWHG